MDSESCLKSLLYQVLSIPEDSETKWTTIPFIIQIMSLVISMDLDSLPKPETELISLIKQTISIANSLPDSKPESQVVLLVSKLASLISSIDSSEPELMSLAAQIYSCIESLDDEELSPLLGQIFSLVGFGSTYSAPPELKFVSLIKQLMPLIPMQMRHKPLTEDSKIIWLISTEIITLVSSTDWDSMPKSESKLISIITQITSLVNSMDLASQPKPLSKLISLISQKYSSLTNSLESSLEPDDLDCGFTSLFTNSLCVEPEPKLISLILQMVSLVYSMDTNWEKLISICPLLDVSLKDGKLHVEAKYQWNGKLECLPSNWERFSFPSGAYPSHFLCRGCNGENHKEYNKAPVEIKHPLHPKHSLKLACLRLFSSSRKCYCCDEDLIKIFYCCTACDLALNYVCVQKKPDLSMDLPKWHEHTLALFPRQSPFACSVCALPHSSSPFYVCPPCDFVIHQKCIILPRVIRISRHPHRISFTHSFDHGDWSCGVCRRKIDNDYGGYSCINNDCSYAAHSKCATQSNVWDGKELEGEQEEDIEDVEPFVMIDDGIIQHFSHEHHMRLDVNTGRDCDENKLCQACTTPIYFGNFYTCMQCDYILHEACANFSRKIYHPIHPHLLTLSTTYAGDNWAFECSACLLICTASFFYKCNAEGCYVKLHVQCATTSEPLVHPSHMHPLFLTSKPGEEKRCCVCQKNGCSETFNCIEDCDFALCFCCATMPQKVRYKHDKHMLTLSYGDETSIMTYWCEGCETKVDPKRRFYMCDEYCCVTLHMECMLGKDLYMKPGSSWYLHARAIYVLPNNHHMSRPICFHCKKRCPYKIVFKQNDLTFCSLLCMFSFSF